MTRAYILNGNQILIGASRGASRFIGEVSPPPSGNETARFGTSNASGTGAYDTSGVAIDGTYGEFTVSGGVITPSGSQTAGSYTVGGWPVEVSADYHAVANQTEWNALSASQYGKTVVVRVGARITWDNNSAGWGRNASLQNAIIWGDGDARADTSSATDAEAHFNYIYHRATSDYRVYNCKLAPNPLRTILTTVGTGTKNINYERCAWIGSHPDPFGDYSAGFPGGYGYYNNTVVNGMSIRDCFFKGCSYGISTFADNWLEIVGNYFQYGYADAIQLRGHDQNCPTLISGNVIVSQLAITTDSGGPHPDGLQILPGSDGANIVVEGNFFYEGDTRANGRSQTFFLSDNGGNYEVIVRGCGTIGNVIYAMTIAQAGGCRMVNCGWLPRSDQTLPVTGTIGNLRYGSSTATGTQELTNSFFRTLGAGTISGTVTQSSCVDIASYGQADFDTALPSWEIDITTPAPTFQQLVSAFTPAAGQALDGDGPGAVLGLASGAEMSAFTYSGLTTPVLTTPVVTPSTTTASVTIQTNVDLNPIFWVVVPSATSITTTDQIKKRLVSGGVYGYQEVPRLQTGTDIAISVAGLTSATSYTLYAFQENGWTTRSAIVSQTFTTD